VGNLLSIVLNKRRKITCSSSEQREEVSSIERLFFAILLRFPQSLVPTPLGGCEAEACHRSEGLGRGKEMEEPMNNCLTRLKDGSIGGEAPSLESSDNKRVD
jgi:hypothetical protein